VADLLRDQRDGLAGLEFDLEERVRKAEREARELRRLRRARRRAVVVGQ
jgi:hypothetical protein